MTNEQLQQVMIDLERKIWHHATQSDMAAEDDDVARQEYHTGRQSAFTEVMYMLEKTNALSELTGEY